MAFKRALSGRSSVSIIASVAGMAALLGVSSVASATPITTWSYAFSQLQYGYYDDQGQPQVADYNGISPNVTSDQLANGLKLYSPGDGSPTFSLTGDQYIPTAPFPVNGDNTAIRGNRFTNYGGGTIDGAAWQHPDDIIKTTFDFGFEFSGGTLELYRVQTFFLLSDSEGGFIGGVGSSSGFEPFEPAGYGLGFAFEDRFGFDISNARNIFWGVEIYFDWTGYAAEDTLAFTIPPNSIDIQAQTVPAPGAAGLVGVGGLIALRRRR